jgi:LacI family transcriptional regulator
MVRKRKRNITIRDVADLVGVHHSTVSRALSPDKREKISVAVVKKVEAAAKELGYYPNIVASSLKQNRSFAVGVLIPDLMNPMFPPIIRGIQDTAEPLGYTVITANTDDEKEKADGALKMMLGRSIDGVIIATAQRTDPIVDECNKHEIPFVLVNRIVDHQGVNAVVVDDELGIRSVLDHLLGLGHKSIAHIAGPQHSSTGFHRARVMSEYLISKGLPADIVGPTSRFTIDEGRRAFRELISAGADFSAVVAANDLLALGCLEAMQEMGIRVPEDMSITGYDDFQFLDRMNPALTTVMVPKYDMGAEAASILLEMMDGEVQLPAVVKMKPQLVLRGSTAILTD